LTAEEERLIAILKNESIPRTQKEYRDNFNVCPFCSSEDIDGGSMDIEGDVANQYVTCNCGAEWTDYYQLTNYFINRGPGEDGKVS
jgi:hypothetical protein